MFSNYCGFLVVFSSVAWVGVNPVNIGNSYAFLSPSGRIPYNDFKYKHYNYTDSLWIALEFNNRLEFERPC